MQWPHVIPAALLTMGDTEPWPLLSDEEIRARVEAVVENETLDMIVARYRGTYGETPPIRRADDGCEARGVPLEKRPWRAVENPRHTHVGNLEPLQALPLCRTAPEVLDCTWARFGCAHVDRNSDGAVDATDAPDFDAQLGSVCATDNEWCDGADLDRTSRVDATDRAFFEAAEGCHDARTE